MSDQNLAQTADSKDIRVSLTGVRLAFTDALFEAKPFKQGDKKRFSCKFLIPKESAAATAVKDAIVAAAKAEFKDDYAKVLAVLKAENKLCLTDGDIKDYDGYKGNFVLSASNKVRPQLLGPNRQPLEEKDGMLYSGVYVVAKVSIWAQNNDWGKRINCNLRGIQFFAPGEAFTGGGVASADEFEDIPQAANTLSENNSSFI
jgi:hypothetical protein